MDIKSAFDTIQQDKVLQVVERMLDRVGAQHFLPY
jgi:hypothetical protein